MTHVVTENCILCKHTQCVDVCPVDCFREAPLMLVIDPDECIDCGVCVCECPVNAIYADEEVPNAQSNLIAINKRLVLSSPVITRSIEPLPSAHIWKHIPGKAIMLASGCESEQQADVANEINRFQFLAKAESLSPEKWASSLLDPNPIVRLIIATRADFVLTPDRLDAGIRDHSEAVRLLFISKWKALLSSSQIDRLLRDSSKRVRVELVNSCAACFGERQFDIALHDHDADVRLAVIHSPYFFPTKNQVFQVLEADSWIEVQAMLGRLNEKLVKVVLQHPSAKVRCAAFGFTSFKLSNAQVQAGLEDADMAVKLAVIQRTDFQPTPEQFDKLVTLGDPQMVEAISQKANAECLVHVLNLKNEEVCARVISCVRVFPRDFANQCLAGQRPDVVLSALRRLGRNLTQKQLDVCLQSKNEEVRRAAITQFGGERLSEIHVIACLQDPSDVIRSLVAGNDAIEITEEQLGKMLEDDSLCVRLAAASRTSFLPTMAQLTRGLADKSEKVRELYSARYIVIKGEIVDTAKREIQASSRKLKKILGEIASLKSWTKRKHQLKEELLNLLETLNYTKVMIEARSAMVSQFGEHLVIDVPNDKRGQLQSMRGKKAHLICLGHGRYSRIIFAVKAM